MLKGFYTVYEAARLLQEPEHKIRARIARGELKAVKVGSTWLIAISSLKALASTLEATKSGN